MSPGQARDKPSLKIWLASRLHDIEQEGDRATGCPLWIFRRPPHACHSSVCSFLFLMMAYSLFLHGSAVREVSLDYGPGDLWKELVVDDSLAGVSLISYELLSFSANNRHYLVRIPRVSLDMKGGGLMGTCGVIQSGRQTECFALYTW
ncbi:unnamed protein product [Symbiodinium natans]|uniref:Uncharacterized protein n=1 Tax=Symbiodinium natans TaxID=878477 RepID=A0A812Q910_9DINO|nr:unnamed protein product [Symbiodinium natans]